MLQNHNETNNANYIESDETELSQMPLDDEIEVTLTFWQKVNPLRLRRDVFLLEPAVFLLNVGLGLATSVFQNQLLYQSCRDVYGFNENQCEPMLGIKQLDEDGKAIEKIVQPYVTKLLLVKSLMENLSSALLALFIGSWSDKFGRRPLLLITFMANLISYIISTILAGISVSSTFTPYLYLLVSIPIMLCGANVVMNTVMLCYISDKTDVAMRPLRFVLNIAATALGTLIGNLISSAAYAKTSVTAIFGMTCVFMLLSNMDIIFFAKESLPTAQMSHESKFAHFFSYTLIKDFVQTCIKPRPALNRATIWVCLFTNFVGTFISGGDSSIIYLSMRSRFSVTLSTYNVYNAISTAVDLIGGTLGTVLLRKYLHLTLYTVILLCLTSVIASDLIAGLAAFWWQIYLSMSIGLLSGILAPMVTALIVILSSTAESGKILSLMNGLTAIAPLISTPIYTAVFNATLDTNPGAYNFIGAGLQFLCWTMIGTIYVILRRKGVPVGDQAIINQQAKM